jgi:hypothetical protein
MRLLLPVKPRREAKSSARRPSDCRDFTDGRGVTLPPDNRRFFQFSFNALNPRGVWLPDPLNELSGVSFGEQQ